MLVALNELALTLGGTRVLDRVNLHVAAGEICGLLGPNGAGKTTTISVITGLRRADSGRARVLGRDPAREATALHREIGVLSERSGFYDWMDADAYLAWFARLYGLRLGTRDLAAQLAQVGLDARDHRPIATYSMGMRQRLGLARALLHRPRLLVLDEPTNSLDPRGRREVHDLLIEFSKREGVGILLCTHLLDDVDRLCSRVSILHHGRTVLEGPLSELFAGGLGTGTYRLRLRGELPTSPLPSGVELLGWQGKWARLQLDGHQPPQEAWRMLLNQNWPIEEIQREASQLEDLYLRHTGTEVSA